MAPIARGCNRDATATISPWRGWGGCRWGSPVEIRQDALRPRAGSGRRPRYPSPGRWTRRGPHRWSPSATRASRSAREGTFGRCSIGPYARSNRSTRGLGPATRGRSRRSASDDLRAFPVAPRAAAEAGLVEMIVDRGIDDAEDGSAVPRTSAMEIDQSGWPGREGPGAVDRIDDPDEAPAEPRRDRRPSPRTARRPRAEGPTGAPSGTCRGRCPPRSPGSCGPCTRAAPPSARRSGRRAGPWRRPAARRRARPVPREGMRSEEGASIGREDGVHRAGCHPNGYHTGTPWAGSGFVEHQSGNGSGNVSLTQAFKVLPTGARWARWRLSGRSANRRRQA